MKKVGLYFGTFNPIHIGHLAIANHMVEFSDLDEIWLVVTPQSPFKKKKSLLEDYHRYQMVYEATKDYPKLKPSDIEFKLKQPNFTIDTLTHLNEALGEAYEFSILMGEDNLKSLHKWKNYEQILSHYSVYVYPRIGDGQVSPLLKEYANIHKVEAPIMEISSTFIRREHALGKNIKPLMPKEAWTFMDEMNFYKG